MRRGTFEYELENIMSSINLIEQEHIKDKKENTNIINSNKKEYIPNENDLKTLPFPPLNSTSINKRSSPILIPKIPLVKSPLGFNFPSFSYNSPPSMINYEPPPSPPKYYLSFIYIFMYQY